ncbi:unnamed protein product [Prorocentrum cordatum]|uniref:Pentatricopeptide repeat-containing protein n=1 Tax=Prorocentrum cordatum TaxID=2364126 RepID=A0ABN9TCM8_9DINO|nr:unnamed protein product [Polarella glacialis]
MCDAKLEPDFISCNAGISACEKGGQWQRALALLSEMRQVNLEPTSATALGSARARRASSGSGRLRCWARCGRLSWSPTTSATTLRPARVRDAASGGMRCRCSARCGSAMWRRATSVATCAPQLMRGRLSTRQDFQAILGSVFRVFACLAKHCACEHLLGNHFDFVDGHPHCGFDSCFYRAAEALLRITLHGSALVGCSGEISMCEKERERERESDRERERRALKAGHATAQRYIDCEVGAQCRQRISELRDAMSEPKVLSYNAWISACAKSKQWQRALELLSEMCEVSLEPTVISYNAGISARARKASSGSGRWRC